MMRNTLAQRPTTDFSNCVHSVCDGRVAPNPFASQDAINSVDKVGSDNDSWHIRHMSRFRTLCFSISL